MATIKDLSINNEAPVPSLAIGDLSISSTQQRVQGRRKHFVRLVTRTLMLHVIEQHQQRQLRQRQVIHPGGFIAALHHIDQLLKGSPKQFKELFRMTKPQFQLLLEWLEDNAGLADTKYQTSAQKLLIFLWMCAFSEPQRNASHCFACAQSSVSTTFNTVLIAMQVLFRAFVKQPGPRYMSADIELARKKRYEGFSGCVGACDGTIIRAHLPTRAQGPWYGRKLSAPSQNVFAAVRFNTAFSYVLAGAEGSMHDNRLLREALSRSFRLPEARFYVGDAGFGGRRGLLVPWSATRYWQQDFDVTGPPTKPKELYNLRHARIRNVVERTFGIVKRKWKILRSSPPEYKLKTQIRIVYATCALHNFTLLGGVEPGEQDEEEGLDNNEKAVLEEARQQAVSCIDNKGSDDLRTQITKDLWARYRAHALRSDSEASDDSPRASSN